MQLNFLCRNGLQVLCQIFLMMPIGFSQVALQNPDAVKPIRSPLNSTTDASQNNAAMKNDVNVPGRYYSCTYRGGDQGNTIWVELDWHGKGFYNNWEGSCPDGWVQVGARKVENDGGINESHYIQCAPAGGLDCHWEWGTRPA